MQAVAESGLADILAIADPSPEALQNASRIVPHAKCVQTIYQLLELELDGIVIASPSALHADQSIAALERNIAVFCQKPLGRSLSEVEKIVATAQRADVLLGIDLSYRFTRGIEAIRDSIHAGELGKIYAANLVFHNAYGPDKSWFYHPELSGGGCVIDLGVHLVDLALLLIPSPVTAVSSRLFCKGVPINPVSTGRVEDFAIARLDFASGATAQIACSWNLHAGQDAIIEASFYGDCGGASLRNVNGSFLDFTAELYNSTSRKLLAGHPDSWGPRALLSWVRRLAAGTRFDCEVNSVLRTTAILDSIYQRS